MNLTAQQVREKLHIGETRLKHLVADGTLKPINARKEGAKKFFMKFKASDVNAVAKELKVRQPPTPSVTPSESQLGSGIRSQLDRIESKLDQLFKLWS